MRKVLIILILIATLALCSCSQISSGNFVLVESGTFMNINSNYYGKDIIIEDFYISKYEVTGEEWLQIMEK